MDKLKEYNDIRVQIEALEVKRRELEPDVMDIILESDLPTLSTEFAEFRVTHRDSWTYSEAAEEKMKLAKAKITQLNEAVKIIKKQDEITGKAIQGASKAVLVWKVI